MSQPLLPPRWAIASLYRSSASGGLSTVRLLSALAAVMFGALVVVLRQPGMGALDTLWAEDGSIFLPSALEPTGPIVLLEPAVGYVHLVPRLLASVASLLPLPAAANVMSGGAALFVAALSLFVFVASGAYLSRTWIRVVLAGSVVLVPAGGAEVLNSSALLHFFLLYAAFWALIWVPTRPGGVFGASLVIVLAALSDPLTVVLLPLVIGRVVFVPEWRNHVVTIAFVVGCALQLLIVLSNDSARELFGWVGLNDVVGWFIWYVVMGTVTGDRTFADTPNLVLAALVGVAALVWLTALVAAWRRRWDHRVVLAMASGAAGTFLYLAPVIAAGHHAPRYAAAPVLLFTVALLAILDALPPSFEVTLRGALTGLLLLTLLTSWSYSFQLRNERTLGPSWSDAVTTAQARCETQEPDDVVEIPITPPGWTMEVTCDRLG